MEVLEFESYLSAWKRRLELEKEEERRLAQEALSTARYLSRVLIEKYGARRVYLFGSLALYLKGLRSFKRSSDIDLAVEMLPKDRYFPILREINRLSKFEVDLIDINDCPDVLRELILKEGIILDED